MDIEDVVKELQRRLELSNKGEDYYSPYMAGVRNGEIIAFKAMIDWITQNHQPVENDPPESTRQGDMSNGSTDEDSFNEYDFVPLGSENLAHSILLRNALDELHKHGWLHKEGK